ncbi:MAG: hypothetical protein ACFB14_21490 [Leptolyngbyaceae cyanobacterium]
MAKVYLRSWILAAYLHGKSDRTLPDGDFLLRVQSGAESDGLSAQVRAGV